MKTLEKIARQTHDLRIFTDGERRYGNLLFEICHELVNNGKRGRPKKTFKRGVHVRMKNKGSQGAQLRVRGQGQNEQSIKTSIDPGEPEV